MRNILFIILILFFSIFFVYRAFSFRSSIVDTVGSYCLYPVLVMHQQCTAPLYERYSQWRVGKQNIVVLAAQNDELARKCKNLEADNIALQASLVFSQYTKELRAFRNRCYPKNGRVVHVLAKKIEPYEHSFIIDAGSNNGIEIDMIVVHKNCLVGKVDTVFPWYSKVLLISDRNCTVAGYCFKTRASGIYGGMNDDSAQLKYVNHLQKVTVGDRVISSGQGTVYPQGLGLGTIGDVQKNGVNYDISLKPLIDLKKIDYCILLER